MTEPSLLDCLVVGAGPAGLTAGIYLQRFRRQIAIIDAGDSRAKWIPESQNTPGFPYGISGEALLARLQEQLAHANGAVRQGVVLKVERIGAERFLAEFDGGTLRARTVLLATGVKDLQPELPGVEEARRAGVLRHCPICDAFEFAERSIGVIGGDAHCVRKALFLRDYSENVTVIGAHADTLLDAAQRAQLEQHGVRSTEAQVTELVTIDAGGVALRLSDGSEQRFDVVYAALGCSPTSQLARDLGVALDEDSTIPVDAHCETNVPGVYAAGDVVAAIDQIAVAVGHAAIAATAIHNRLRERKLASEGRT